MVLEAEFCSETVACFRDCKPSDVAPITLNSFWDAVKRRYWTLAARAISSLGLELVVLEPDETVSDGSLLSDQLREALLWARQLSTHNECLLDNRVTLGNFVLGCIEKGWSTGASVDSYKAVYSQLYSRKENVLLKTAFEAAHSPGLGQEGGRVATQRSLLLDLRSHLFHLDNLLPTIIDNWQRSHVDKLCHIGREFLSTMGDTEVRLPEDLTTENSDNGTLVSDLLFELLYLRQQLGGAGAEITLADQMLSLSVPLYDSLCLDIAPKLQSDSE